MQAQAENLCADSRGEGRMLATLLSLFTPEARFNTDTRLYRDL